MSPVNKQSNRKKQQLKKKQHKVCLIYVDSAQKVD